MQLRRIDNPPNPFEGQHREWLGPPPVAKIEVYEEESSTILSKNDSPDLPFTWSVNPYRGCQHACVMTMTKLFGGGMGRVPVQFAATALGLVALAAMSSTMISWKRKFLSSASHCIYSIAFGWAPGYEL